jgi:FkbH-like protein
MSGHGTDTALALALARVEAEGTYAAYMAAHNALDRSRATAPGSPFRLGVLRNFTIEPLIAVIETEIARIGLLPRTYLGDFDAIAADALDPRGPLAKFDPDAIVIALWLDPLAPRLVDRFPSLSADDVSGELTRVLTYVREMVEGIRRFSQAPILLNNFPLPHRRALGILESQRDLSQTEAVLALNRDIRAMARAVGNVFIVDYLSLFGSVGTAEGFDERNWVHRRSPLSRRALIPIGQEYAKYVRALRGLVRKCVVVDCDNTLWGGIVGEEGLKGIQLGGGPGANYTSLQRELLNLHDRGVLVALCSKNNEADVLEVLRSHPDMLLKESHVACHRINWEDKASNLRAIAKELNIGLDSLVFVDDSAFECELVREQLPEVAVVQLKEGTDYGSQLARHAFFDSLVSSKEDTQRTAHFKAEAQRRELQSSASSLEEFLERLEMVAEIGQVEDDVIPRVAQLTQKTNQFNLTTRRYTEADIRRFVDSGSADVLYVRLKDKVADLGIVGVAILQSANGVAEVDTFLMSCRALGRGLERVMLDELRRRAEERGCQQMRGLYIPTAKNAQTAAFYTSAGFAPESTTDAGLSFIATVSVLPHFEGPIRVVHSSPSSHAS